MKVPVSWLREMAPTDLSPDELAELLTSKGAEVEAVERPWEGLRGVIVARVIEVSDHPNANRLCVARVDTGAGEMDVVVGVRNMGPGDLVPYAPPGARVPALSEPLGRKEVRGVTSNGMLCSPQELSVAPDHSRILVLDEDASVGADFAGHFGLDDGVLDIAVTPNRPDLLSVAGVAREVSAATGVPLTIPEAKVEEGDEKADDVATVEVRDLERCPWYLARIIRGVAVGESPLRIQARLTASGMRPLSNVVDATNYVLLELGQPLHPFDLALLSGPGIVVRRADDGEGLVTLDGVERVLTTEDLVIADKERAVAVAGVMGSAIAEVSESTVDVLLESANFERIGISRTSRRLGLVTEASRRFERRVDPEAVARAADRAASLMAEWAGGAVLAGAVDVGRAPDRRRVRVRPERAGRVVGLPLSVEDVSSSLERIGVATRRDDGAVEAEIPGFRPDLEQEDDLVEEVIRVLGYERVGETLPPIRQPGGVPETYRFRRLVREVLAAAGLLETTSYSFASARDLELTGDRDAVEVANPLAADDAFLRTSLLPGLLRAAAQNVARQVRGVAVFEVGRVFFPADPVEEHDRVAAAFSGQAASGYPDRARDFDFTDAKGALEVLLGGLGVDAWELGPPPSRRTFHPGRSASVYIGGELAGEVGELSPRVVEQLDLPRRVAVFELEVEVLAKHRRERVRYRGISRHPPNRRDLAFVVDVPVPAGELRVALIEAGGELVDEVVLFDVFTGPPIPEGKRSVAFSVDFRAPDRTVPDGEADEAVRRIVDRLRRDFGAELRA
ncbi:MAG: phenylalanine--tRNA ligase subunit beta [Actinomycetota bacterium]